MEILFRKLFVHFFRFYIKFDASLILIPSRRFNPIACLKIKKGSSYGISETAR